MTLSSLRYEPPVRRRRQAAKPDYSLLEAAAALADEGRAVDAVTAVYRHLFPAATIPDLTAQDFTFVQGSSKVVSRIEGDELSVRIRLVRVPKGNTTVATLRYTLTKISGSGQLYQPRLRGDELWLEFRDRLSRLHPAKVLEVLRRMPFEADRCDDWLISQFQAEPLDRADIQPLDETELARSEGLWRTHWSDVEELGKESQRKRSIFFLNELTAYAVHRLQFALPLSGSLGTRLAESAATFNDGNEAPLKRESTLTKFAREMQGISAAELAQNLGHAEYALSPRAEGTPALLSEQFDGSDYMETIDKLRSSGKSLDAALALISTYNYLLARFSWPEPVEDALQAGLAEASDKPWREAASALFAHAQQLVEAFGADAEEDTADAEVPDDAEDDEDDAGEEVQP
jgi:hypothetical protein